MREPGRQTARGRGAARPRLAAALGMLAGLALARPLSAQLPNASAADLGIGNRSVATTRGFAAVANNPAGLAMPRTERTTVAAVAVRVPLELFDAALGHGFEPVSLGDFADFDGEFIPDRVKEAWLELIEDEGAELGRADASIGLIAISHASFGFQLSALTFGGAELNPDASELLLFGNDGRTGDPREFHLAGSRLDGWLVTTAAVAAALPLEIEIGNAPDQSSALGATLKYSIGSVLFMGRDLGTFFSGDPLEVWVRFPVVHSDATKTVNAGDGIGLDVGFQWEGAPWQLGVGVSNVFNTFEWDLADLVHRPGSALFTEDEHDEDFRARPASEAPEEMLAEVRDFRFRPRLSAGGARLLQENLKLAFQVDAALGANVGPHPDFELGAGAEYRPREWLPLRAHASVVSGGARVGGGLGVQLGRFFVSAAGSYVSAGVDGASVGMLTFSWGGS